MNVASLSVKRMTIGGACCFLVVVGAMAKQSAEVEERIRVAAASMEDAVVVDCQLPGKLRKLGGTRTYLTPGRVLRAAAVECRTRGGEYTLGDLASGTLSLKRWLPSAADGDPQAQYYVARIYANGMDSVPVDYTEAARWYRRASDLGNNEAKQELGYLYEQGFGVEKDPLMALNLQREASGLGEDLDYAWKIAEAERVQQELADTLEAANAALQLSRIDLRAVHQDLASSRAAVHRREVDMAGLLAELAEARRQPAAAADPAQLARLQGELDSARQEIAASQTRIVALERQRDAAQAGLQSELIGGQAASLELRELLAVSRQETEDVRGRLASEQQRLIQSEEEIRALQQQYLEDTERLAAENQRLFAARSRSETDSAAERAAREAEVLSRSARVESLEAEVERLREQLASTATERPALQQELNAMRVRYERELTVLREQRERLGENLNRSQAESAEIYAQSQSRIADREQELEARKRQIDTLRAETDALRDRVSALEARRLQQAQESGSEIDRLRAQLVLSRKDIIELNNSLEEMQAEKSAALARLSQQQLDLQKAEMDRGNRNKVALLEAEIAAGESTIRAQSLRIEDLQQTIAERDAVLAQLRNQLGQEDALPVAVRDAMAVLDMARSPNLGTYHALLIANEEYQKLPPLTTPVRDVSAIKLLLQNRYGFNVQMLTNASDDQIMKTLHDYSNRMEETDNLLIYYAGRGSTPTGPPDRAYWLGVDSDPEFPSTWLLAEHVSEKIKQISAKRILVITDSCFSKRRAGSNALSVGRGLNPERFRILAGLPARLVLTSGANLPVTDKDGDQTHSLFAKVFIEVLRQNSNVLSGEMLSHEMIFRVHESVEKPERATPTYQPLLGAGHGNGDFFFVPSFEETLMAAVDAP